MSKLRIRHEHLLPALVLAVGLALRLWALRLPTVVVGMLTLLALFVHV